MPSASANIRRVEALLLSAGKAQSKKHYAASLHDITVGNNDVAEIGGAGFNAATGWDPVTGLGSPNAVELLPLLVQRTS